MSTSEARGIFELIAALDEKGWRHISFEVGKLGRVDRFVLVEAGPDTRKELLELSTQPPDETAAVLHVLDDLVASDPAFGILYNNPRTARFAYCLWQRISDRKEWATVPKIEPLYLRRMDEQRRICAGEIKRGHREFGFWPLDGHG